MELKPGYKRSDVGEVPGIWAVESLGDLAQFVTSGSRGWAQFYSDYGALFIRSQNVRDGLLRFDDIQYVSPPSGAEGNRTKVELNDLLITITGNSVGNVALVDQVFDEAYISQHVGLVRLKDPTKAEYICRYLSPNSPGNFQIAGSQSGQSKPGLNLQNLKDFVIALPSSSEELHAITSVLSDVDALLATLEKMIAKKCDLRQAAMQQLLTGEIQLAGFNKKWLEVPLGEIVKPQKGQLITTKTIVPGYIPVIAGGKQPAYFHASANRYGKTITVSASGASAGYVAFHSAPIFASDCSTISESEKYCIEFIYYALQLRQEEIYSAQTGGAQPHIQPKDLVPILIKIPEDVKEQAAIASVLSDMDAELSELEARRVKTRNLKQAMMQELLTGKTRLV